MFKKEVDFTSVKEYLMNAKGITWDTCHKIFIMMDEEQVKEMHGYGYDPILLRNDNNQDFLFDKIKQWYKEACSLKFVDAIFTNPNNPNEGFVSLIPQGAEEEYKLFDGGEQQ